MAQKWNLGDIVPPERSRTRINRPTLPNHSTPTSDMRPRTPREAAAAQKPAHHLHPHPEGAHQATHIHAEEETMDTTPLDEDIQDLEIVVGKTNRFKRYLFLLVLALIAVGIGIVTTIAMSGADITVRPKAKDVAVSASIEAKKNPAPGELGYELLSLSEAGERRVSATGQQKVSTKATGQITISNAFSTARQRLIKNTRFESPDGFIFRIVDSVEIPGYTKDASGSIVAGTAIAKVIADGPGDTYNVKPSRFTIPGLKGSEQFDKVYAESKDPMAGGFDGMKFIIDEGELSKARQELHLELREKLLARLKTERPNGFTFFEPSVTFAYDMLPATDAGAQTVVIKDQARLLAPLFRTDAFATFIAEKSIPGYEGETIRIEDPTKLGFSYTATSSDISTLDSLSFRLEGSVRMIWTYDTEKLRSDLRGAYETVLPQILSDKQYGAIEKSRVIIRPFWKNSFPSDLSKIRITESFDLK
jgi:hypothetical protein